MLQVKDLAVNLSNKKILDKINFTVEAGGFVSILGPSGCGKSTLLKAIAGVLPDYSGEIIIDGVNVNKLPPHKRNAVIVFQDIRLFPHMNVQDNISFAMKIQGKTAAECSEKVTELLGKVQLQGYEKRKIHQLSGGQQQRVALARALAAEPKLLLLDEPFSGLDENLRFDMKLLLIELHRSYGMTTVMVTHDKEEALSLSNRIIVMADGDILQIGTPQEVFEQPNNIQVAKYFGNATFLLGNVLDGIFQSREFIVPCQLVDGKYVMMIRDNAFTFIDGKEEKDFRITECIYTGRQQEILLQHNDTGFTLRCSFDSNISFTNGQNGTDIDPALLELVPNNLVSVKLDEAKLKFFSC